MVEVKVTEKALSDIIAIGKYISRDSVKYASMTVQSLYQEIKYLEEFPEIGRIVPEVNSKTIREIILGNYRIIYWIISKKRVDVIAIHNSAQRLSKIYIKRRKN